jgi:hypothetical protein
VAIAAQSDVCPRPVPPDLPYAPNEHRGIVAGQGGRGWSGAVALIHAERQALEVPGQQLGDAVDWMIGDVGEDVA